MQSHQHRHLALYLGVHQRNLRFRNGLEGAVGLRKATSKTGAFAVLVVVVIRWALFCLGLNPKQKLTRRNTTLAFKVILPE